MLMYNHTRMQHSMQLQMMYSQNCFGAQASPPMMSPLIPNMTYCSVVPPNSLYTRPDKMRKTTGDKVMLIAEAISAKASASQRRMYQIAESVKRSGAITKTPIMKDFAENAMVHFKSRRERKHTSPKSSFFGVFWNNEDSKWLARIFVDNKSSVIGAFDSQEEAALAYDMYAREVLGENAHLNFKSNSALAKPAQVSLSNISTSNIPLPAAPEFSETIMKAEPPSVGTVEPCTDMVVYEAEPETKDAEVKSNPAPISNKEAVPHKTSSIYRGVCWNKCNNSWKASIKINKRNTHIGYFDDSVEAALAYDLKAYEIRGNRAVLNFPERLYEALRTAHGSIDP